MLMIVSAKSQSGKWLPGRFTDTKGNKETGFIRVNPSAKGPVKDEGFIEFRDDDKTNPFRLSASEVQSFVIGRDSFVVAHAPGNSMWGKKELDFVKVAVNEEIKVFVAYGGGGSSSGGGHGIGISSDVTLCLDGLNISN